MNIVISTLPISPESIRAAEITAKSWNGEYGKIATLTELPSYDCSEMQHTIDYPILNVRSCFNTKGQFLVGHFLNWIDTVPADRLSTIVIDSSSYIVTVIDTTHTLEHTIPYYIVRRFFWSGPRPKLIVHFVTPDQVVTNISGWSQNLFMPPLENRRSYIGDAANNRLRIITDEVSMLRKKYHPWYRLVAQIKNGFRRLIPF